MIYFTADLHLGHRAIIDHSHRPFLTVEAMDSTLVANINKKVGKGDLLYILGDFSLGNFEKVKEQRAAILCPAVYLVRGNHDRLSDRQYQEAGFIFKGDLADIKVGEQHVVLAHYAMRRWPRSHYGAWQLFGHSHGQLVDDPTLLSFDVGVDCWGYHPLSFDDVAWVMEVRKTRGAGPHPNSPTGTLERIAAEPNQ